MKNPFRFPIGKKREEQPEKILLLGEDSPFFETEAYRSLKVNISLSIPKKEDGSAVSFFLTSYYPNEGKTTVAANLAVMFAQANEKVLLIDADMRKGKIHEFFGLENKVGLSDCLSGKADVSTAVKSTQVENLFVLPAGHTTPNPYELLGSNQMQVLYNRLKGEYGYIIVDTPPLGLVSDCLAVIPYTDGCAVVSRYNRSRYTDLRDLTAQLRFAQAKVLGVIFNGVQEKKNDVYGKRYGRYGRYSSYGYGGYGDPVKKQ